MLDLATRQAIGPFLLTRPLEPAPLGDRFLALHEVDQSSHVAHRLRVGGSRLQMRRFVEAVRTCEALRHPHVLPIEYHTIDVDGRPWVITPYSGDVDGLRTLTKLLREKHGQMDVPEAERAIVHMLEAVAFAHRATPASEGREARLPIVNGPHAIDQILVDRHGRVLFELYGLSRQLRGEAPAADAETVRDEVRSIVEIAYQLITGLRAEAPFINAGRLMRGLDPAWDRWLGRGLEASEGFDTAAEALAALPSRSGRASEPEPVLGVRSVLGRLRPGRW